MTTAAGWVLSVQWDGSGRVSLAGVPTVSRGPLSIFFTGVLADLGDWRREIGAPSEFTPAEIVSVLLERHRTALFSRLRGSFVVAFADQQRSEACVARDPLGSHPLFHAAAGDARLFAATPLPLVRDPRVGRALNRAALADHLCKRWPDRQESFFEGVKRVPPGWAVQCRQTSVTPQRYWNPVGDRIEWLPAAEADRFDERLDRAVDRGLEQGAAGIFLSGGFDSVSVAAVAADRCRRASRPSPIALSLGFPDPDCNEEPVQRSVAQTLGLPLHLVPFREAVGARGLLAPALDLNADLAAPCFNTWAPAYAPLVRYATSQGVHTILTGEGGDEWLGVTPFLAADMLRRGQLAGVWRLALATRRSYRLSWPAVLRGTLWRYGLRPLAGLLASRVAGARWDVSRARRVHQAIPSWVAPDPVIRRAQWERALHSLAPADPAGGFYSRESKLFLDHPLTSWLFEEQYQFGHRFGIRYVHPYWDPDLLVHAYRTNPEQLNRGGRSKGLVRSTVARRFPELGFERHRKVTALGFFASLCRREGPPLGEQHADFGALGALGVVDPAGARAFMRQAWLGSPKDIGRAWNLVNLESWARTQLH
jgi:asparagine synthase (glutamine-hydrolysing)